MNEKHPNITITIEEHLESYGKYGNSTERHRRLWHAWAHNKGWLEKLLQWTLNSFPGYSMHDASHAESVLHNIEMTLGEHGIRQLSASDCFLILHTVYIHDIGMCITDSKRKEIMQDKKFVRYLRNGNCDKKFLEYAQELLNRNGMPKPDGADEEEHDTKVLMKKLVVYHAVVHLVSEYKRRTHAKDSEDLLAKWVLDDAKLGAGFSTSGIPLRLFLQIANCAGVHNSSNLQDIMNLDKVDDGYANDYVHPRFAAVLLQLGDTLDLDNDRFHPLIQQFMDDMPDSNYVHIGKHKSIRQLWISPKKITISSDCGDSNELRLVQREYEALKSILKNAKSEWIEIRPMDADIILPDLKPLKLYLRGREIASEFANMRFEIQQNKAFRLLQGGNFYKDRQVVFLREIFQNAVDATKLQIWKEWKNGLWDGGKENKDAWKFLTNTLSRQFPIEVNFYPAIKHREDDPMVIQSVESMDKHKESIAAGDSRYGVLVSVRDYGVGISSRDLREISKNGTSMARHDQIIESMPEWMKPTAEFGIGLQSVFLMTDRFTAKTHVRHGEKFRIDFSGTGDRGDGRINVIPIDQEEFQYGTEVRVFLPIEERNQFLDEKDIWRGYDPFSEKMNDRPLKMSREMIFRMANYMMENIKDPIVPVRITIHEPYNEYYSHMFKKTDIGSEWISKSEHGNDNDNTVLVRELQPQNWEEDADYDEDEHIFELQSNKYRVDFKKGRMIVRNRNRDVYACFSSANMLKLHALAQKSPLLPERVLTKLYYKGVYVSSLHLGGDMDLLEYIDIKGGMDGSYLALNRADFTEAGKSYIRDVIYPEVIDNLNICIRDLQQRKDGGQFLLEKECGKLTKDLCEAAEKLSQENSVTTEDARDINGQMHRRIVFFGCIRAFCNVQKRRSYYNRGKNVESIITENVWNATFCSIIDTLRELKENDEKKDGKNNGKRNDTAFYNSYMYNIPVFEVNKDKPTTCNLLEVINCSADRYRSNGNSNYGYAIVSYREHYLDQWREYLLRIPETDMYRLREEIDRLRICSDDTYGSEGGISRNAEVENILRKIYGGFLNKEEGNILKEASSIENGRVYSILLWVLDQMPSMAIFSECAKGAKIYDQYDRDLARREDCRINILDTEQSDSIYFADRLKMDVLDRMRKKRLEEYSVRFATYTSTSFCQLGVNELPSDVHLVMRGRLGKIGCRKMILPITGDVIDRLFEENKNLAGKNSITLLKRVYSRIDKGMEKKEESRTGLQNNFERRFHRIMGGDIESSDAKEMSSLDDDMINKVADYAVSDGEPENRFYDGILRFCIEKYQSLVNEQEEKDLIQYYALPESDVDRNKASEIKEELIQYVYENRYIRELDKVQIEDYYGLYIRDMLRIMNEKISWRKKLKDSLEDLKRKVTDLK